MKKMKFMLFAVAAIAAASCAKEELQSNTSDVNLVPMTFNAGSEGTKVLLQGDKAIHWESSDKIKIYDGITADLAAFETSGNGPSALFSGKVSEGSTEYYAVYPHTAANGFDATNKTLSITLPETQIASAGNVPSNAFISVAKADAENNLAFRNVTAFVKFSLSDATNVKSVTISGNAGESLTGDMTVTIADNGTPTNTTGANMNYTATLSGTFESGKDYYVAVRSAAFAKGVTVSIYKHDGTNGSRAYLSSKTAPETTISRNMTLDLKQLDVTQFKTSAPSDQYLAYLHGYNVEIGDYKLHKNSGIKPKLVTATKAEQDIKSAFAGITGDVLLFLEQNEGCSFIIGSHSDIKGNIRLIGRKTTSKVSITNKGYFKLISGSLYAKNLLLSQNLDAGYIATNSGSTADFTNLYFDDCKFTDLSKNIFYNSTPAHGITNISVTDCDIKISSNVTLFKEGNVTTAKLNFSNNIIYSENGNYLFILDSGASAAITDLTYTRNSLINCYPNENSYIYIKSGESAKLTNNLFYLPDYGAKSGSNYRAILRTSAKANNPGTVTVNFNHCHRNDVESGVTMNAFKASFYDLDGTTGTTMYFKQENLFTNGTFDLANGIFISGNASYGATR